jgi:TatD DNase family protein
MLDLNADGGDLDALVQRSFAAGLESMLCVNVDKTRLDEVLAIAERYPAVYATVGLHPSDVANGPFSDEELLKAAQHPKVVALGETGLDYYYNDTGLDLQRDSFAQHIRLAKQLTLPIVIHTRAAVEDTLEIMRREEAQACGGVMHCFTESLEMAESAMEMGFYISISGIVTFKNAKNVQAVAKAVPLERLLIETDAPYLTPVPYRGKPNRPEYVRYVAEKIAELKGISYAEVARVTTENYYQLFRRIKTAD